MITFACADDAAARADWAQLLADFPAARVHADARWLDLVNQTYGAKVTFAIERDTAGVVCAALAGYQSRTLRGQGTFHSLRHGVLTHGSSVPTALMAAVADTCRARGCVEAVVGGGLQPLAGPFQAITRVTLGLDLTVGSQRLWDGFRDKVRNTIRKADRGGLTVSRDHDHLKAFHAIHARTMTERRGKVRTLGFFQTLFSIFGPDARLYSALDHGRVCGAMVVIVINQRATYPFGAFDEEGRRLGANSLLLWHVARDLVGESVQHLDLGPSAQDSGTYRFKVHLGGAPQDLHYVNLLKTARPQARAPSNQTISTSALGPAQVSGSRGRLDNAIAWLPFYWQIRARTWLGRKGRLL